MRFKKLGLEGKVDWLFTSGDHETTEEQLSRARTRPDEFYQLNGTGHSSLSFGRLKPDPALLLRIIAESGASLEKTLYVGDSLYKDVLMANEAKVAGAWAKYGEARDARGYELLRSVSHWSNEDVKVDREMKEKSVNPNYVLTGGIKDLLKIVMD